MHEYLQNLEFFADQLFRILQDDPLSAVDGEVGNSLFQSFKGYFMRRSECGVLMSLNQFHLLSHFDYIYVLSQGKIIQNGTYEELMAHKTGTLSQLMRKLEVHEHKMEEEEDGAKNPEHDAELHAFVNAPQAESMSLIKREVGQKGAISMGVMWLYLRTIGCRGLSMSVLLGIIAYSVLAVNDLLVFAALPSETDIDNMTKLALLYMGLSLIHVLGVELLSVNNNNITVKASVNIHNDCISTLFHSPITW